MIRAFAFMAAVAMSFLAVPAFAQEAPLSLSHATSIRIVTGPNPLGQYVEGDVIRISVFLNHSSATTSVIARQAGAEVPLAYYSGPIMDDLYQAVIPFDPALTGVWTITATRGNETESIRTPGQPEPFDVPLLGDLHTETVGAVSTLHWNWPDLSEARALGLGMVADMAVMQEDNRDEFLLNFGVRDNPIPIGAPDEPFSIVIPGGLEAGRLFIFRVHLDFYDAAENLVAKSITFIRTMYAAPND